MLDPLANTAHILTAPVAGSLTASPDDAGGCISSEFASSGIERGFFAQDITEKEACVMAWTDGSGRPPDRTPEGELIKKYPAGWAFVATFQGKQIEHSGKIGEGTSNEAELTAIIKVMELIKVSTHPLIIFTDSTYARNAFIKWGPNWRRDGWVTSTGLPVKNKAMIERGMALIAHHERRRLVLIRKVKGHSGITGNELADKLAGEARKKS